jgi:hypothetical protein
VSQYFGKILFWYEKNIEVKDGGREGGCDSFRYDLFDKASLSKTLASSKKLQGS